MYPSWLILSGKELMAYQAIKEFLSTRLMERETFTWALKSDTTTKVKRMVIRDMVENPYHDEQKIEEPWRSAWEAVIEGWNSSERLGNDDLEAVNLKQRLEKGERSASLAKEIVDHFRPRLDVRERGSYGEPKGPKKPRSIKDLLSLSLSGGSVNDLKYMLGIKEIVDAHFLGSLAYSLQAAIRDGLDIAGRAGWNDESTYWLIDGIKSVAYRGEGDPDDFTRGLEAPVKLFHAVVDALSVASRPKAMEFMRIWEGESDPLSVRLWASFAYRWVWIEPRAVGDFLLRVDDRQFWEDHYFPEIVELRSKRFAQLDTVTQEALWARIRKLQTRDAWPRIYKASDIRKWHYHAAFVEAKRIEQEGVALPLSQQKWMLNAIRAYPEFSSNDRIPSPYQEVNTGHLGGLSPDMSLDTLEGSERLSAIEKGLVANDLFNSALEWMRQKGNVLLIIDDINKSRQPIWAYPKTWQQFCYEHKPRDEIYKVDITRNIDTDYKLILSMIQGTPEAQIHSGIKAFSEWLGAWGKYFVLDDKAYSIWLRLVDTAESLTEEESRDELMRPVSIEPHEGLDPDKLVSRNYFSPAGWLTGVFITAFLNSTFEADPFGEGSVLNKMRSRLISCTGSSHDIVLCRFAEILSYLLRADTQWTQQSIIEPLRAGDDLSKKMWESLSHRTLFEDSLKHIKDAIILPCTDYAISRVARERLIMSVIVECLNAYREKREPYIAKVRVVRMLYSLDEEARAHAVGILSRFLFEVSKGEGNKDPSVTPEFLWSISVKPFIEDIWPKERSLTTPIIAREFAHLPAASRGRFAEAVECIERFLVPFDCHSMLSFNLHGKDDGVDVLKNVISSPKAAKALLGLLDRSIAYTDRPTRPYELMEALSHIKTIDPALEDDPCFIRLSMLIPRR